MQPTLIQREIPTRQIAVGDFNAWFSLNAILGRQKYVIILSQLAPACGHLVVVRHLYLYIM